MPEAEEASYRALSSYRPRAIEWEWEGYIPQGKITLLAGDGEIGKSLASLDLAARITSGRPMPDGKSAKRHGGVLIVAAEDDVEDTILPRFLAMGGDPDKVIIPETLRDSEGNAVPFVLPDDLPRIRQAMEDFQEATGQEVVLVIIDPITGHLAEDIRSNVDPSVRRALLPLSELLAEKAAAGLLVIHTNKDESKSLVNRIMGSKAFYNIARSVLVFALHPNEEGVRMMARAKSNISAPVPTWRYRIEEHPEWQVGVVRWETSEWLPMDRLLIERRPQRQAPERSRAEQFLLETLDGVAVDAKEIHAMAEAQGIAAITLRRAAEALGVEKVRVRSKKTKQIRGWKWRMPHVGGS